jgi:hypothetical protein
MEECPVEPEKTSRERAGDLIRLLVPDWRPTPLQGLWAIRIGIVLGVLIAIGYAYGVTLLEWVKLLIVPAAIAGAGLWFNQQLKERELQMADQRAQTDQEIADQRRQDDMLQAYLDEMSQLLSDKDRPLNRSQRGDTLSTLARARTLTVAERLDGIRKGSLVQFLYEARLIIGSHSVIELRGANLNEANLRGADLSKTYVVWTKLGHANLSNADLSEAYLRGADLHGADLRKANLEGADLNGTNLEGADLNLARRITTEQLEQQIKSLEGATMPNGQKYEDWLKSQGRGEDGF